MILPDPGHVRFLAGKEIGRLVRRGVAPRFRSQQLAIPFQYAVSKTAHRANARFSVAAIAADRSQLQTTKMR